MLIESCRSGHVILMLALPANKRLFYHRVAKSTWHGARMQTSPLSPPTDHAAHGTTRRRRNGASPHLQGDVLGLVFLGDTEDTDVGYGVHPNQRTGGNDDKGGSHPFGVTRDPCEERMECEVVHW